MSNKIIKGLLIFSRVFVGGLFIVSGLIKANDPLGFSYKLEEYFEDGALAYRVKDMLGWKSFTLEFFMDYALLLSVIICVVEIVLGVAVLLGVKSRLTSWLLLLMVLFFSFLTLHTATCVPGSEYETINKAGELVTAPVQCVTDCGCFGDALKGSVGRSLTPWESFTKDLVLLIFILPLFFFRKKIKPNLIKDNLVIFLGAGVVILFFCWVFGWYFPLLFSFITIALCLFAQKINQKDLNKEWSVYIVSAILSLFFSLYCIKYLPLKDYRPFAVGSSIHEKMNDGIPTITDDRFLYRHNDTKMDTLLSEAGYMKSWKSISEKYTFVEKIKKVIVQGKDASIKDFTPEKDYEDLNENEKQYYKNTLDSLYPSFYEKYYVLKTPYGYTDSVPEIDYDSAVYDSTYHLLSTPELLADPSKRLTLRMSDYILDKDYSYWIILKDEKSLSDQRIEEIKSIADIASEKGVYGVVLSSISDREIHGVLDKLGIEIDVYSLDKIFLKAVVRSDPGVLLLKKDSIINKWPGAKLPSAKKFISSLK